MTKTERGHKKLLFQACASLSPDQIVGIDVEKKINKTSQAKIRRCFMQPGKKEMSKKYIDILISSI